MGRHPSRMLLMAWHDGEIDAAEAARVAAHCQACARCRHYAGDLELVGAAVRGEPVPVRALADRMAWSGLSVPARVVPALAGTAAVVALVFAVAGGGSGDVGPGGGRSVASQVALPGGLAGQATTVGLGGSGATPAGGARHPGPGPVQPGHGDDSGADRPSAAGREGPRPLPVGVVTPGGSDGPGAPVIDSVRRVLGAANAAGGVGGRPFELWVGDATDPTVADAMADAGVRALVGGYGLSGELRRAFAERGVTWFGPTDEVEASERLVPLEIPHSDAGRLVGEAAFARGRRTVFVVGGPGSPEAALGAGVSEALTAVGTVSVAPGEACDAALAAAAEAEPDVVVLALPPDDVGTCLGSVERGGVLRRFAVPSTAADVALDRDLSGLDVTAALGAPNPKDLTRGVVRFRNATGLLSGYRALVSFAAAEMAVEAFRHDPDDPGRGFLEGAPFHSDLLTMDPGSLPYNRGARVAQLGGSPLG